MVCDAAYVCSCGRAMTSSASRRKREIWHKFHLFDAHNGEKERERERKRERWLFFITKAGGFCHEANMSRDCCLRNISSHMWIIWFTLNLPCEASFSCFSGAFAKLRNATITIIMSVCLSLRKHATTRLLLHGF